MPDDETDSMTSKEAIPTAPVDPCYSRLLPRSNPPYSKDVLPGLAGRMIGAPGKANDIPVPSGLIYFGQFIDHDLTRDRTRLEEEPYPQPDQTRNWRTPKLDLESLYANGHDSPERLPDGDYVAYDSVGHLRFDVVEGIEDLPRNEAATPMIPESRNDENLIIAQLHLVFMKFHNRVLDLISKDAPVLPAADGPTPFARARLFVIWHYQWLVRNYFLSEILHPHVRREMLSPSFRPRLFNPPGGGSVPLPVEFTMAAFRFGHSMIRDGYILNAGTSAELSQILNRNARRLEAKNVIDWGRFFAPTRRDTANAAQKIDPTLAPALYTLSDRIVLLYKEKGPASEYSLAARTLLRGWKAGLPSGQQLCELARIPFLAFKESDRDFEFLREKRLLGDTPLWYYILHEAEVAGTNSAGEGGRYLGPLGSHIVGEVFQAIFNADGEAYPQQWRPPTFQLTVGGDFYQIDSLPELIAFATNQSMTATTANGRVEAVASTSNGHQ